MNVAPSILAGSLLPTFLSVVKAFKVKVINMVEVTIYFHHGGEWITNPEPHYDRGCVTYWKGYDPDLISFIDLVNEYINKLGFVGVQELIVLASTGKYFEIIGDEGVRTLTSFISIEYKSIHLFATEDC
ncbi:hypothetical protein MTR67_042515 [Solanum verrucosum]|uniref:PB1-like domain-containing protein n=1 Tax=Solanum verrucosum TaxID=315347 RepID=A0AAF0ZTR6_SOLVR|nr:hypothetical protein MTR67_042515 [Solanum verrucosum]